MWLETQSLLKSCLNCKNMLHKLAKLQKNFASLTIEGSRELNTPLVATCVRVSVLLFQHDTSSLSAQTVLYMTVVAPTITSGSHYNHTENSLDTLTIYSELQSIQSWGP